MDNNSLIELVAFSVIVFRLYMLGKFQVNSVIDKMFGLYTLKNHTPFIGYIALFYIEIIIVAEYYILGVLDVGLLFLAAIDVFVQYKNIFISLVTNDKQVYLDTIIKSNFKTLTKDEYYKVSDELNKSQPMWKLYSTELIVFLFVVWTVEFSGGFSG